ncbi:hypothetical protein [Myxococcus qinghaiensis]|uniref:hypothetical protein n=1 Tax=Myxococcus qinghaiensis TaxID=2906758 RepID=UPI0020A700D7|nr:hypothetical protein [Myxococcus qinghaiensis]MCP3162027.1 hypothetical protein [Myxococcus qinghaiensis]
MHSWRPSFFAVVLCALTASAQGVDSNQLIVPRDRTLEVMLVDDQAGDGASHTLGWLYYDELVGRGYIDLGDPADPNDDVLIDAEGNGIPDFHEDLFNLNPDRGYIGDGTRCIPERIFFHQRASGEVLRLREPELLTGSCGSTASYAANIGPRRWEDMTGFPARPGGSVVGQRMRDSSGLFDGVDYLRASAIPGLVDTYFSDRGVFPHIPNLLEPDDAQNGHMGLGHLVLLSTDDDANTCPNSSISECFMPRQASAGPGQAPSVGPIWDRSNTNDGIPDYKTSAFDPEGRVIPGRDVTAPITEGDRRVSMGTVMGGREIVFFLVSYVEQIYNGTDTCFLPDTTSEGRLQCELWGHGDINVYFSKTLLNLDLNQLSSDVLASPSPRSGWLESLAYTRLRTSEYGNVQITETDPLVARSHQQRTPHVLMLAPMEAPDTWVMGWEDMNSGGNRTFNDAVFLVRGVGAEATEIVVDGPIGPVYDNQELAFTARVTTSSGEMVTSGLVSFYVDGSLWTSIEVDFEGKSSFWLMLSPGEHVITAVYEGLDGQYQPSQPTDYGVFVDVASDGGTPDGGAPDGGRPDSGVPDAGAPDAGVPDAGAPDSGVRDAGAPDAGVPDAGAPDSGVPDAGVPDAGAPDSGVPDAGIPDAGVPDSGPVPTDGGPVTPQDGGPTEDDGGTLPADDAGTPQADDAGADAGEDSGTPPPPVDAGDDAGTGSGDDAGADAGTNTGEDAGPEGPDTSGPRDLTVTGWGCGATDAGSASVTLLALWLGLSFLRSRGRRIG